MSWVGNQGAVQLQNLRLLTNYMFMFGGALTTVRKFGKSLAQSVASSGEIFKTKLTVLFRILPSLSETQRPNPFGMSLYQYFGS